MSPSGLLRPDLSWAATRLGLVREPDAWLDMSVSAYLTASEYLLPFEQVRGNDFDPAAWVDALLRMHSREAYVEMLAALNRAAPVQDAVRAYQQRFLGRLGAGLRRVVELALTGGTDARPRWFLARQPTLRAMRLVLTASVPREALDARVAEFLGDLDCETAAVLLVHLVADDLRKARPENEPQLGGMGESLAMELVCNQIFNEPRDVGGVISRTWSLWTQHADGMKREKLHKDPVGLLKDATGLALEELLAPAFAYWVKATETRVGGPLRVRAFSLLKLPEEKVECFLALYSTTLDELASALEACEQPWQMLPLQTRPLLRIGEEVVVLDESFLWEAVTTGLYWRVFDHVRQIDESAWKRWSRAYAEMVEALSEDLIKAIAPLLIDGSRAFFTEDDIKAAFPMKKGWTPLNADIGIDFGNSVVLFEIVNKNMTLAARSGELAAFKKDVDQAVVQKTRQLDGTGKLLRRTPQPDASPLKKPAAKVFPIVVCGNHFPVNPVTRTYAEECVRDEGWLQDVSFQPLAVMDLDELEACAILGKGGHLMPDLLSDWLSGPYARGSFNTYLVARHGGQKLTRPDHVGAALGGALNAIKPLLNIQDDGKGEEQWADRCPLAVLP